MFFATQGGALLFTIEKVKTKKGYVQIEKGKTKKHYK